MVRFFAAIVAVFALSGCAGTTSTDSETKAAATEAPAATAPTPNGPAATGEKISGTGYTYNVPDGWGIPPEWSPRGEVDSLAIDLKDAGEFQASMNVIRIPGSGIGTLDDVEKDAEKDLIAGGSTDISINDRVAIGGTESLHVTSTKKMDGQENITDDFLMLHGENAYGVTFSFHGTVPAEERADVRDAVLAGWTWTD